MKLSVVGAVMAASFATATAFYPSKPTWTPTYVMSESTAFMPCNDSGFFDPAFAASYGISDFDWSDGKQVWANNKPMTCEELLVEQADATSKAAGPGSNHRNFVYRNLVKALPWFTSVREKLDDPAYSGFFLRFKAGGYFPNGTYHVPACTGSKCSVFYHDQDQTPQHPHGDGSCTDECDCGNNPCGEYLWDHRNGSMLRDFLVNEFVLGPTGLGHPDISGFYFDDDWTITPGPIAPWAPPEGFCSHNSYGGPTEEDRWCIDDMGLSPADVKDIYAGWSDTISAVESAVLKAGGFAWQYFWSTSAPTTTAKCQAFMQSQCQNQSEAFESAMLMDWTLPANGSTAVLAQPEVDVASFLLARRDYAWIGFSWAGCSQGSVPGSGRGAYATTELVQRDYGVPTGICSESSPGVYSREWTKASISLDCNTMTPTITMK